MAALAQSRDVTFSQLRGVAHIILLFTATFSTFSQPDQNFRPIVLKSAHKPH